jgi:hypothetical protein
VAPGSGDVAFFDSSGAGSCTFNIPVSVNSMHLAGYRGSFFGDCTCQTLYLDSGLALAGDSDTTAHILGDVSGNSTFGTQVPGNYLTLSFDGSGTQNLFNAPGCIFPSTVVNTDATFKGAGTVLVHGDFIVNSGTCDTNGLDLNVFG